MSISYYQKTPVYSPVIDAGSVDFKRRALIQVGQLRYGRRGDSNYYAMIALFDCDLLELHKREHLAVKGRSYEGVISDLYDLVFNN